MANTSLLTAQQRKACQGRANQPAPNGPRAKALLALDKGSTQQQAADEAGLSLGQVRYCLRRFRNVAMALFDAPTPSESKPAVKTVAPSPEEKTEHKPDKGSKKSKDTKSGKKGKGKGKKLKPIKPKADKGDKKDKKKDKKSDKSAGKKGKKDSSKKGKKKKK
ncbi:helix-turn-helix domain-containing protein [Alcanivorax sp.]|uniref:helix-turn-helix domain-containing protein n=1 Tax=Alcanivorax sp. TaxID=1872427 RepID=UPI0025BD7C21|nr:helix-turn-helix domain-containing protein [Alcanivorax sp.]